jgi:hypothetical protein
MQHIQASPGQKPAWPHLVERDERADHLLLAGGKGWALLEAADVVGTRQ